MITRPTKRALDAGYSAAFFKIFLASSLFISQAESITSPISPYRKQLGSSLHNIGYLWNVKTPLRYFQPTWKKIIKCYDAIGTFVGKW